MATRSTSARRRCARLIFAKLMCGSRSFISAAGSSWPAKQTSKEQLRAVECSHPYHGTEVWFHRQWVIITQHRTQLSSHSSSQRRRNNFSGIQAFWKHKFTPSILTSAETYTPDHPEKVLTCPGGPSPSASLSKLEKRSD